MKRWSRWSQEELDYLRMFAENPDTDNCITVAKYLNRTPNAVRAKVHKLRQEGVQTKLFNKWTAREINILTYMNGKILIKEQAELLGRTVYSVSKKRSVLGLSNARRSTPVGKGKEICKLAQQGLFRRDIANRLELNYSSLCKYLRREGIPCVVDEEGRLEGFREVMKGHNQVMAWVFHKEK